MKERNLFHCFTTMSIATYRGIKYDTTQVKEKREFLATETYRGIQHSEKVEVRK